MAPCDVTMGTDQNVTATFAPIPASVNVTLAGGGSGTVTSSPAGISCPGTCGANFNQGSQVTLTATPNAGSTFTGWTGDCTGTTNPCQVTVDAAKNVTATFTLIPRQLTVNIGGTGSVTSNPAGISCPTTCGASYPNGTAVTLTAAGSGFLGWSGGCTGTGTCQVTMNADTTVTATFSGGVTKIDDNDPATDPAIAYNGWFDVADAAANGGFYRMSNVKNDKATWKSPAATSITWVTRTGPDQGKASVTIDGTNKGTVDLYSASPASPQQGLRGPRQQGAHRRDQGARHEEHGFDGVQRQGRRVRRRLQHHAGVRSGHAVRHVGVHGPGQGLPAAATGRRRRRRRAPR